MESLGREGSPEFHARLAELLTSRPVEGKVAHLIWRYLNSPEFKSRRPLTQRDYRRHLDKIKGKFGALSTAAMASPRISDQIYSWRDQLAEQSPRQADYTISVLSALLNWSVSRGLIEANRAAGVGDTYTANRQDKTWGPEQEKAFLAKAKEPMRRVMILGLETGLSQEDLLVLPKSAIRGNIIVSKRLKNGTPVAIPISPTLKAMLDAMPSTDSVTILTKADGRPWETKGNGLRNAFRKVAAEAGVTGLTFHDMRGTFVSRRRAMGWTAEETALCSGHKVKGEEGAQSAYVDRLSVSIANAERLWTRFYRPKRERKLQTDVQTKDKKAAP